MCKILSTRLFRCLICLILVCCFLVNASPIRAKATGVGTAALYALGAVAVEVVVAAAFQALGVMSGSDSSTFRSYVNDAVTWLTNSTTYVTNGMVQVLGFMSSDGVVKSFAMKDMIQAVWEWLFDSGTVVSHSSSLAVGDTITMINGKSYLLDSSCTRFQAWQPVGTSGGGYVYDCLISVNPIVLYLDGTRISADVYAPDGVQYCFYKTSKWYSSRPSGYVSIGVENVDFTENVTWRLIRCFVAGLFGLTSSGLVLGQIQGPYDGNTVLKLEETETYEQYATKIIEFPTNPDDDTENQPLNVPWLPVGLPSTDLDEILTQNQDQAQSGDTSLDFDFETSTDPGTGTDPDTGTDIEPNPDPDSGTNTGSGSWTPPSDYTQFQLVDLKNFFPFCIPFDLFRFFELLNAEPEAPVLYWEMQDLSGQVYSVSIDLSEWDSVALLFRRLQLFLFIVGLAAASRKFIKW